MRDTMTTARSRSIATLCTLLAIALSSACGSDNESKANGQASSQAAIDPGASDGILSELVDGKIRCDQFVIRGERVGDHLEVWIETDLPDSTEIYLTVYRSFFAKDSEESAGALVYYSNPIDGSETVGRWRDRVRIPIDDSNARTEIEEQMQDRAVMGRPSALDRVESSVGLVAGLLASQKDPRFKAGLTGQALAEMSPGVYWISHKTAVDWAFSGSWQIGPFGNPEDLQSGTTYVLERDTPLAPYHELRGTGTVDEMAEQIASVRTLLAGTAFTVRQRLEKTKVDIWYEVDATERTGWINGVALTAQVLPVHSVRPTPIQGSTTLGLALAAPASAETVQERLQEHFDESIKYCTSLPPRYVNTCVDHYQSSFREAASTIYPAPDIDRLNETFARCAADPTIAEDANRRPHIAPSIVLGCVSLTYGMES